MISRLDYVANQGNPIDTYVPMPFKEMNEALQAKQQEYDSQQNLLNTADKSIKGVLPNVSETYKDTKGRDVINPHAQKLNYYNNILDQQKQEIFNKYKNDLTSSEAKSEIANFARSAASIYNEVVPDAINTEAAYKESKKRLDERKGAEGGYRLLDFDRSLYNLAEGKTNRLDTSNISDEHKFEDLDKNFLEGFKADVTDKVDTYIDRGLLAKVDYGKKVKELTEKEIANRYDSFYKTNHLPIVEKSADYDIEHEYQRQKSNNPDLSREQFNKSKSIKLQNADKAYTPEEYKKLLIEDDKQRRLDQAKRYAYTEEDKSQSSSFLPGIDFGEDKNASTAQTYESSGTLSANNLDFTNINDEESFVKSNSRYPVSGTGQKTAKGNYVVGGSFIDKLQQDFKETTGSNPTSFFGGYSEDFVKFVNNKGINVDNRKDVGATFYYKDNQSVDKEIDKQKLLFKTLQNPSDESLNKLTKEIPQFKGVVNLLKTQGISKPTKEQLIDTYNKIAPSAITGTEVALSTEELDHTVNLITGNLRHYKVYNKQGGTDEGTTVNTIPVTYDGKTKPLGEWISSGVTLMDLAKKGAVTISKEIDNPNSIGGETIKTTDEDGKLIEFQTGGINSNQRSYFKNNNVYHSNVNNTKDYYNITKEEQEGGTIGSSKEVVKSDPLILNYLSNLGDTKTSQRLSDGYYESKTKTKTYTDNRGVVRTMDVISIYDSTSGDFIGDIPKDDYMEFRKQQYNKGLIGQKK